jgi:hypothetical protein
MPVTPEIILGDVVGDEEDDVRLVPGEQGMTQKREQEKGKGDYSFCHAGIGSFLMWGCNCIGTVTVLLS